MRDDKDARLKGAFSTDNFDIKIEADKIKIELLEFDCSRSNEIPFRTIFFN